LAPKNPKLTLVGAAATGDGIPTTLREHGRTLWQAVMGEYQIDDIGGLSSRRHRPAASGSNIVVFDRPAQTGNLSATR
jgi:hypothetical protein